jgi:predicted RNA-binding Zn-ribbon protein involved in translation (DUF1610 family)
MKDTIKLGELSVSLKCPVCGSSEFISESESEDAEVKCKKCGRAAGAYSDVRDAQLSAAKKGISEIKTAVKKSSKGIKGSKSR